MKCKLVYVGTNVYVVKDRMHDMPPMRILTDKRVIDLYRKESRCAYRTADVDCEHMFADGPFESFDAAKKFIDANGYELKTC